jgi:hypothetical protein
MRSTKILTGVVIFQSVLLAIAWVGPSVQPAMAQIPDSGAQRTQMLQEIQGINSKMDRLLTLLDNGVQVRVAKADDKQGK